MERRDFRGIHFIRVQGNSAERATGHFKLLKEEIKKGAIPVLAKKNEWLIRRGPGLLALPPVQAIAVQFYKKILTPLLASRMTPEEKQALQAAVQVSDFSYETLRETLFQADALMVLARTSLMKHLLPEWLPGSLPGCSSAVVLKDWTRSGRPLVCRNFDYFIVGEWEQHPTVVFNEPTDPGEVPFVSLTTAGVHVGGITSMNREGLTLCTHAHFGRDVSFSGRAIVLLGDEVIRKAKTLDQAIDLLRKNRTCANWSFVLSSGQENRAIVVEMTPKAVSVREAKDGFIAHSNYFITPALQKREALLCGSFCEDVKGRYCQLRDRLEALRGEIEPSHMSSLLGNHEDYFTGQERVFGNTMSVITTVQSAVFDPGVGKLWMANRHESPVGLGEYIEVDTEKFWKQSTEDYSASTSALPHYRPKNPSLVLSIRHYREAYRWFHIRNNHPEYRENALACLRKAIAAYPLDGHVWLQAGLLALTLRQTEEAVGFLEKSQKCELSEHVTQVRDLYLARAYDLQGQRNPALKLYKRHSQIPEPKLRKAYKKGLFRPYRSRELGKVQIDLQFPDTFLY